MKKIIIILCTFLFCTACSSKTTIVEKEKEDIKDEVVETVTTVQDIYNSTPTEVDSLQTINQRVFVNMMHPPVMGISDEKFLVYLDTIGEYKFNLNGKNYSLLATNAYDNLIDCFKDAQEFASGPKAELYKDDNRLYAEFGMGKYLLSVDDVEMSEQDFYMIVEEFVDLILG